MSRSIIEHAVMFDESNNTLQFLTPTTYSLALKVIEQRIEETTTQHAIKKTT